MDAYNKRPRFIEIQQMIDDSYRGVPDRGFMLKCWNLETCRLAEEADKYWTFLMSSRLFRFRVPR